MEDNRGRDIAVEDKGTNTIWKNTKLHGYQDTWVGQNNNGLFYFEDGIIRGRTDYICGKGDAFYNRVEFQQVAGGYAAVPSVPAKIGWVMKDCTINGDGDGVDGNYTLGRPWGSGTPVASIAHPPRSASSYATVKPHFLAVTLSTLMASSTISGPMPSPLSTAIL